MERMTFDQERQAIAEAVASLPATFGLRAFPGVRFRCGHPMSHFVSEGEIQIVVQSLQPDGQWLDFGRNTPEHIRREITDDPLASAQAFDRR